MVISKQIKRPSDGPNAGRADIVIKERRGPPEMAGSRVTYRVDQDSGAPPAAEGLASLLTRMGIEGSAGLALLERVELLVDPTPALAWWWFLAAVLIMIAAGAMLYRLVERPFMVMRRRFDPGESVSTHFRQKASP